MRTGRQGWRLTKTLGNLAAKKKDPDHEREVPFEKALTPLGCTESSIRWSSSEWHDINSVFNDGSWHSSCTMDQRNPCALAVCEEHKFWTNLISPRPSGTRIETSVGFTTLRLCKFHETSFYKHCRCSIKKIGRQDLCFPVSCSRTCLTESEPFINASPFARREVLSCSSQNVRGTTCEASKPEPESLICMSGSRPVVYGTPFKAFTSGRASPYSFPLLLRLTTDIKQK